MKNSNAVIKTLTAVILVVMCSSAFAEYRAITKFPVCQLVGGSRGCDGVTDPNNLREVLPTGVDETDIQACDVITENINAMEKFNVDWNCDFPISSNSFLLSKPQWVEVTGEERCNATKMVDSMARVNEGYCEKYKRPVFSIPYDLDGKDGNEKIYTMPLRSKAWNCGKGTYDDRVDFWTAEADGTSLRKNHDISYDFSLSNEDLIIFSNRLYMVHFYDVGPNAKTKGFTVGRFKFSPDVPKGVKNTDRVCVIRPINPSTEEK